MLRVFACAIFASVLTFAQSTEPAPAFDVADVHVSAPSANPFFRNAGLRGGRYELRSATMVDLVKTAYGVADDKVLGGPSWLEADRYDVIGKAPPSTPPETLQRMLRALLADRFELVVHNDDKSLSIYVLTLGKGKRQMKESDGSGNTGCQGQQQPPPEPGGLRFQMVACHNMTMPALADALRQMASGYLGDPVVDKTGLEGSWDFNLKWTGRGQLGLAGADGISIFDAVDKQLGLKLEAQKTPMPVIVVDRVNQKPTDNPPGVAQSLPAPAAATEFEVADVKPSAPGSQQGQFRIQPSGRVDLRGATLNDMLTFAWDLNDDEVVGAPKWWNSERFDVIAKAPSPGGAITMVDLESVQMMMRNFLMDRFKLKVHKEVQSVNVYALVVPKRETKLKKADETGRTSCKSKPGASGIAALTNSQVCVNISMAQFADKLRNMAPGYIDHPVIESTGLQGGWDFTLSWTPKGGLQDGGGRGGDRGRESGQPSGPITTATDPNGSMTVFEALDKQLGLKLELQKHPMPVLSIDHVEQKPTDN